MNKLSKPLAVKLLQLCNGVQIPASKLNYPLVAELISEGIITDQRTGRAKSLLCVTTVSSLTSFLTNRFSISDLAAYVEALDQEDVSRAVLAQKAADTKVKRVRTFKGFLINSYQPIHAQLNGQAMVVYPSLGTFQFIHKFEWFVPDPDVVVIGVENSENFSHIQNTAYLFENIKALFVSRYPQSQSRDLISWLNMIPNQFLYFGDFDFAGINIYSQEYKKHLGERAGFFVPENFEVLLKQYGNKKLYDKQRLTTSIGQMEEPGLTEVISLINKYQKGLEQEALINITKREN